MIENTCDTCKGQPVPGILSHDLSTPRDALGREYPEYETIERCDTCERFGWDEVAQNVYEVIRWSRAVIDSWESGDLAGNVRALDASLGDLLDDRSTVA